MSVVNWASDKFFGALIGGVAVILLAIAGITVATPDTKNPIKAVFDLTQTITVDLGGFDARVDGLEIELSAQGRKLDVIISNQDQLLERAATRNDLLAALLSR